MEGIATIVLLFTILVTVLIQAWKGKQMAVTTAQILTDLSTLKTALGNVIPSVPAGSVVVPQADLDAIDAGILELTTTSGTTIKTTTVFTPLINDPLINNPGSATMGTAP